MIAAVAALAVTAACGGTDQAPVRAGGAPAATASPQAEHRDAELLGRRAFRLLDQVASYRSSHRGRLPSTVAQLGVDSLTPDMVMRLVPRNDSAVVRVAFRRPAEQALGWCEATAEALEEASLNAGEFGVWCARPGGATDSFTIGGSR